MSSNLSSDTTKMSATKTSKKSASKTESSVSAPVAPSAVAAVAPAKKTTKKTTTTTVVEPVAVPVAAPVPEATAAPSAEPAAAVEEDVGVTLLKSIEDLHALFSTLKASLSTGTASLKTIEKQAHRVVKKAERKRKRKSEAGGEPKPCSFTKPVQVTDELCAFFGSPKGTKYSRSEVTTAVIAYAKAHNLMDKQTINSDAPLRKLLNISEADKVTILNLQKFLNRHYVKAPPAAPLAA